MSMAILLAAIDLPLIAQAALIQSLPIGVSGLCGGAAVLCRPSIHPNHLQAR